MTKNKLYLKDSDLDILRKSLKVIADFVGHVDAINSPKEFLIIHNRNLKMLTDLSLERNSKFIKVLLSHYPVINSQEIELYISKEKKERTIIWALGGVIWGHFLEFMYNLIKSKGTTVSQIRRKMTTIKNLNVKMQHIVEDPIYEEFYQKAMQNNGS